MANEMFTALPAVANATLSDIICAVQGGVSVQETLQQVFKLNLANTILNYPGNPNGNLAGEVYQLCWDTTDSELFVCTTTGIAAAAVWSPITAAVGLITPTQGGTGVANPAAHTLPVAEGSSNFTFLGPLANGQLLIGSAGANPVPTTLTAGSNISILNAPGSITISAANAAGFTWNHVLSVFVNMFPENGYVVDDPSLVTLLLPMTSSLGDVIKVVGRGVGGWQITQNAGQIIYFGDLSTTAGTGGSLASTLPRDSISLVCTQANTEWTVDVGPQGDITVV